MSPVCAWARQKYPDSKDLWAPDCAFFDGCYHLYYAVSTFGTNSSSIGLATNSTLDPGNPAYAWIDRGVVISSTKEDNWNAIDANVAFDRANNPWLAFGSYWSGIKLTRLNPATGKLLDSRKPFISIASRDGGPIEAPFIVRHADYFYLFVSFDQCCRGVDSDYKIMVGRASRITGPYVGRAGNPMMKGAGTLVLAGKGNVRGPGHNAVLQEARGDWLVHHFYDAGANGARTLQIRPLTWDAGGWPVAGDPITQ